MTKRKSYISKEFEEDYVQYMRDKSKYGPEIPPVVSKEKPTLEMYGISQEIVQKNEEQRKLYDKRTRLIFRCIMGVLLPVAIYKILRSVSYVDAWSFIVSFLAYCWMAFWIMLCVGIPIFVVICLIFRGGYDSSVDKKLAEYNQHLKAWKYWYELYPQKKVVPYWQKLSGYKFEKELAQIFIKNGFDTEITKKSGDGGVDIILNPKGKKIYIQCKAYQSHAGVAVVRELLGCMELNDVEYGIIACTGGFTKGAVEMAMKVGIYLLDSQDIVDLMNMDIPQDYFYRKV